MIARVLMATLNYDHPQAGQAHAFRGVFDVTEFDYMDLERRSVHPYTINERFYQAAVDAKPDWIWLQVQDSGVLTADTLKRIQAELPVVITHWTGDARPTISPYLRSICQAADLTLISSVGQIQAYEAAGAKAVRYLQIGLDWHEDVMGVPAWEPPFAVPDVVFCGSYYHGSFPDGTAQREGAVRALMAAGIDVGVVGGGWPDAVRRLGTCTVKQQHHVWRRAKVALSVNHFNGIERYYSDRQLIAMASGTPVVCHYVPGLEHEFVDGVDCLFFRDVVELVDKVRCLLADEDMRRRVGAAGRAKVVGGHTWFHRIMDVLPVVEAIAEARAT